MKRKLLTTLAVLGAAVVTQGQIYINFQSDASNGAYTTDGTNSWNQFLSDADTDGIFDTIAATSLLGIDGLDSGIDFALTPSGSDAGEFTTTPSDAIFQNPPATGFDWFDASVVEQRRAPALDGDGTVTYTFSGFAPSQDVTFAFVVGRESTGTRRLTMVDTTTAVTLLNNAATNAANANWILHTVTGFSSYSFQLSTNDGDSPAAAINAMAITAIPEPSTYAMLGGFAAFALVAFRRFRTRS